jgi:hypothetical protein
MKKNDIWTERGSFNIPYHYYRIILVKFLKIDEYIHIFYYNKTQVIDNTKFYIQGPITRPQNNNFEVLAQFRIDVGKW